MTPCANVKVANVARQAIWTTYQVQINGLKQQRRGEESTEPFVRRRNCADTCPAVGERSFRPIPHHGVVVLGHFCTGLTVVFGRASDVSSFARDYIGI